MFLQVVCVTNWLNNCFCIFTKICKSYNNCNILLFTPVIFHNIISRVKLKLEPFILIKKNSLCIVPEAYHIGDIGF